MTVKLRLPSCIFPAYRADGKPSQMRVLLADHPIAAGIPREFQIDQTEMYDEPFHVPPPDEVVLEERWAGGEWFRSGSALECGQRKGLLLSPRSRNVCRLQESDRAKSHRKRRSLRGAGKGKGGRMKDEGWKTRNAERRVH